MTALFVKWKTHVCVNDKSTQVALIYPDGGFKSAIQIEVYFQISG